MAKKQNIKTMADRILSGNRFNIPPLTEMEKKELKERTLLTILQLKELFIIANENGRKSYDFCGRSLSKRLIFTIIYYNAFLARLSIFVYINRSISCM